MCTEQITVCVPARDEATRLPELLGDLRAQTGVPALRVLVVDDESTDGTAAAAAAVIGDDDRFEIRTIPGPPPAGWTGKAAACALAADLAPEASILVFLDADVRLAPGALAAAAAYLRDRRLGLLSPWPKQIAITAAERRVQPLLCWSWAATLPVVAAAKSLRPSTVVACGQFLVVDAAAYRSIGGHAAVATSVTEDLDLARTLRRHGHPTTVIAAGELAACRMYRDAAELDAGYSRWLWSAHGSAAGGAAVAAVAVAAFVAPGVVAPSDRRAWIAYLAAVVSRLLARSLETGARPTIGDVGDAALHPVSVLDYVRLTWLSHRAHRRRALGWKGRPLSPQTGPRYPPGNHPGRDW